MVAIYYAIAVSILSTRESNYYYSYGSSEANTNSYLEVIVERRDDLKLGPYIGFAIFGVFLFALTRLAKGRYNQLLLLVKFREDADTGEIVPVKLSVAFTILCNMIASSFRCNTTICVVAEPWCRIRPPQAPSVT
eukprot:scaffold5771_cov171-Amphora_coffeaeformis.AAC.8